MTVPINYRIPFRLCCFVSWTMWLRIFAGRFYTRNNRSLNVCMTVLRRVQKVIERLHGGFARVQKGLEVSSWGFCTCTKGPWSWFKGFCVVYKRVLKLVQGVLHVYKKALKLVQGAFARVQKGIERCKKGLVQWTIWAWSNFKPFLRSVQFDLEVGSSRFCVVYNLPLKLVQGVLHSVKLTMT